MLVVSLLNINRRQKFSFVLFIFHQIIKHADTLRNDDVFGSLWLTLCENIEYQESYFDGTVIILRKVQQVYSYKIKQTFIEKFLVDV